MLELFTLQYFPHMLRQRLSRSVVLKYLSEETQIWVREQLQVQDFRLLTMHCLLKLYSEFFVDFVKY